MRIEFASVSMMGEIIAELRVQGIEFECKVDDLGTGYIWLKELKTNESATKIAA
jgi:sensor c-di-GMP phosphodiesterase-like protein